MPITITIHESGQYYVSKYEGEITDEELIPSYDAFYTYNDVGVGFPELADVSSSDASRVSRKGILKLAHWKKELHKKRGESSKKTAIYAPKSYGRANAVIYEAWTEGSSELVRLFEDKDEAVRWLME